MSIERFLDSWRYAVKDRSVEEIVFRVRVWRAPRDAETATQLLCDRPVAWGMQVPSPLDLIHLYQREPGSNYLADMLSVFPGHSVEERLSNYLVKTEHYPCRRDPPDAAAKKRAAAQKRLRQKKLEKERLMKQKRKRTKESQGGEEDNEPGTNPDTARSEVVEDEEQDSENPIPLFEPVIAHLFTRTEDESYDNVDEFVSEVIPAQQITPLHLLHLLGNANRQPGVQSNSTREESLGDISSSGRKMFLMWSIGATESTPPVDDAHLATFRWQGSEQVILQCQRIADSVFVSKPSLNELHTLAVGYDWIITYQVDVLESISALHLGTGRTDPRTLLMPERLEEKAPTAEEPSRDDNDDAGADLKPRTQSAHRRTATPQTHDDIQKSKMALLQHAVNIYDSKAQPKGSSVEPSDSFGRRRDRAQPGGTFTAAPARTHSRQHHFVTVNFTDGVEHDNAFVRCHWIVPPGVLIDEEINQKTGIVHRDVVSSQIAIASRFINHEYNFVTRHIFNVPTECHIIKDNQDPRAVRLVIEVLGCGETGGHHTLHGYGVVTLTEVCGMRTRTIDLWRPSSHGKEDLKELFIGGSTGLVSMEEVGIPYVRRQGQNAYLLDQLAEGAVDSQEQLSFAVNSRAGLITESLGSVDISVMSIMQSRPTGIDAVGRPL